MIPPLFSLTVGAWKPAIGDPSLMGWFTVFSYYLAASLCFFKLIFQKRLLHGERCWHFWAFMGFALMILGFVKQFNLLGVVTEMGRMFARSGGWIEHRRSIQVLTMILVFLISLASFGIMYRPVLQYISVCKRIALAGLVYLILFITLRAISLHHFGIILGYEIGGIRVNWIAELLGIYWIGLSIFWLDRRTGND